MSLASDPSPTKTLTPSNGSMPRARLAISLDKFSATLTLEPAELPLGDINADWVMEKLKADGILPEFILPERLALAASQWNQKKAALTIRIAEAPPPKPGAKARLEYLFSTDKKLNGSQEAHGQVDFKKISLIQAVEKNQVLVKKIPAEKGILFKNLRGDPVPGPNGEDIAWPIGSNVQESPEDALLLVAAIPGYFRIADGLIHVQDCLEIAGSVDYSTGHIAYEYSVKIAGDVKDGFELKIGGDLEINGQTGDAKIICGGNVLFKTGFIGSGQGSVQAKGSVTAGFTSNQIIRAHGSILIEKESMNCQLFSRENISLLGPIIGGLTRANLEISTTIIGNEFARKTDLEVGCDYLLEDNRLRIEEKIKELNQNFQKLSLRIHRLKELFKEQKKLSAEETKILLEMREASGEIEQTIPMLEEKKIKLLESIQNNYLRPELRIRVERKIFPGVTLKIGTSTLRIDEPVIGPKIFMLKEGHIKAF